MRKLKRKVFLKDKITLALNYNSKTLLGIKYIKFLFISGRKKEAIIIITQMEEFSQ